MNKENQIHFPFTPLKGRKITAVFDEPLVSSDGGLLLLREALSNPALSAHWPAPCMTRATLRMWITRSKRCSLSGSLRSVADMRMRTTVIICAMIRFLK